MSKSIISKINTYKSIPTNLRTEDKLVLLKTGCRYKLYFVVVVD